MFCPYCLTARPENDAPCHNCGAPSPSLSQTRGQGGNTVQDNPIPQLSFDDPPLMENTWQSAEASGPSSSAGAPVSQDSSVQPTMQYAPSMLPVPYQGGRDVQLAAGQKTTMLQLLPSEVVERMLPALPDAPEPVYISPMYTKPRPIIPRRRAINGLLSVLIVCILVCSGSIYAANALGVFKAASSLISQTPAPPQRPSPVASLPDPKVDFEQGPAYGAVNSVVTSSRVGKDCIVITREQAFKPNQQFYIVFNVAANTPGTVTITLYNYQHVYKPLDPLKFNQTSGNTLACVAVKYTLATEAAAEVSWNGKLAERVYFVIRP